MKFPQYLKKGAHGICALILIALATLLRLLLISQVWPVTNSDEGTMGLMALHIAFRSEHPIFFYGQGYMGPFEAYLGAALFHFFGASLFGLRLTLVFLYALFLISIYVLASLLYTKKLAFATLVILCLGSSTVLERQLRAIGGYTETLLFGSLLFLLAYWLAHSMEVQEAPPSKQSLRFALYGCWGFIAGFATWTDFLILPFVLTSGMLLIVFCWRELRTWSPVYLIVGFVTGVLPVIIYNVTVPAQENSWSFLLLTYRTDRTGRVISQIPFIQKLLGTILVSLPDATGAHPMCPDTRMPYFGLLQSDHIQCALVQSVWGSGYIVLWIIAIFFTIKTLWKSRQKRLRSHDVEEKLSDVRLFARLMLLSSVAITFVFYTISPVSALDPWTNSRYLMPLLIATPCLISPLWNKLCQIRERAPSRALSYQHDAGRPSRLPFLWMWMKHALSGWVSGGILLLIGGVLLVGTIGTLSTIPAAQQASQQQDALIGHLLQIGARHIYSEYWTCNRLIFQSGERIICSALDERLHPGYDRYVAYRTIVRSDPNASYVFPLGSPQASKFAQKIALDSQLPPAISQQYRSFIFDGYVIYQPLPVTSLSTERSSFSYNEHR